MALLVEFTVEPFTEGSPGPHVHAAVDAATAAGLTVEFGPFGSTAHGDDDTVLDAVDAVLRAAIGAGASRVSLQISRDRIPEFTRPSQRRVDKMLKHNRPWWRHVRARPD